MGWAREQALAIRQLEEHERAKRQWHLREHEIILAEGPPLLAKIFEQIVSDVNEFNEVFAGEPWRQLKCERTASALTIRKPSPEATLEISIASSGDFIEVHHRTYRGERLEERGDKYSFVVTPEGRIHLSYEGDLCGRDEVAKRIAGLIIHV